MKGVRDDSGELVELIPTTLDDLEDEDDAPDPDEPVFVVTCDASDHSHPDLDAARRCARLDYWLEAILGARLRFHASMEPKPVASDRLAYWGRVYERWRALAKRSWPTYE